MKLRLTKIGDTSFLAAHPLLESLLEDPRVSREGKLPSGEVYEFADDAFGDTPPREALAGTGLRVEVIVPEPEPEPEEGEQDDPPPGSDEGDAA